MQINKIIFGLILVVQSLHAMQGVKEEIDKAIEFVRKETNYDATLVPKSFDSKNWGEIIRYDEEQQCAITHIGNIYYYDKTIKNDKPIGWYCIYKMHPQKTPQTFEQSFNTADRNWKLEISCDFLKKQRFLFIYNQPTKTCMCLFTNVHDFGPYLEIKQNHKQQLIYQDIKEMAFNNDGQYCAYGIRDISKISNFYCINYSIKILKRAPDDLYENADDILTKGDNTTTQEFDLMKLQKGFYLKNLQFLSNNGVQVHTIIFDDKDYLWTITPEGVKTKQECFFDLGNNKLCSLGKIYNFPTLYKKVSKSPYRYSINDPRFLAFIKIEKDRNNDNIQEKKVGLPKELYGKILHTWYEVDPTLRENTTLIYDGNNLSEQDKRQLKLHLQF